MLSRPENLTALEPESLRKIGFSHQKAHAIIELALRVVENQLDLESLAAVDNETALERLQALRGVGRWTAEYVLLRGLGRLEIFPGDDVGARNNLQHWLSLAGPLDYQAVSRVLAPWKRFAGLIYLHLLLEHLTRAGEIG